MLNRTSSNLFVSGVIDKISCMLTVHGCYVGRRGGDVMLERGAARMGLVPG